MWTWWWNKENTTIICTIYIIKKYLFWLPISLPRGAVCISFIRNKNVINRHKNGTCTLRCNALLQPRGGNKYKRGEGSNIGSKMKLFLE